jgi:hypothetical protein
MLSSVTLNTMTRVGRTQRRATFSTENQDQYDDLWRRSLEAARETMDINETVIRLMEKARQEIMTDAAAREILVRFLKSVEAATTLEEVREKAVTTRAELGNMERLELLAGVDRVRDSKLAPVIDMLIDTAFKLGEHEDW